MAAKFKPCSVDGCKLNANYLAGGINGLCRTHYWRWWRSGSVDLAPKKPGATVVWLEAHVNYDGDDCLIWPFAKARSGRGFLSWKGKSVIASRLMCILAHGEPPAPDWEAAHSCGNGHNACVNPKHLRWATRSENMADRVVHGTATRGERAGRAKLSDAQAEELLRMLPNHQNKELALRFGLDPSYISQIRSGKRWGWRRAS